uniref:Uncharacterized protein n=1 Tax=Anopheles maculatus TaxID=74869 RepID=A0A182T6V9_9DIPT
MQHPFFLCSVTPSSSNGGGRRRPETGVVPLETRPTTATAGARDTNPDQSTRGRPTLLDRLADGGAEGSKTSRREEKAERDARPRQQIFRLHQDVVWSKSHHQSMDVCRINSMFNERQPSLMAMATVPLPGTVGECAIKSTASAIDKATACHSHVYEEVGASVVCAETEPIYAVVDVRAKRSRRLARTLDTGSDESDGRANGGRKVSVSLPQISDGIELITTTEHRPVAARSCSNYDDYEDVNYLFETRRSVAPGGTETDSVGTNGSQDTLPTHRREPYCGMDEHIYEPIQVSDRIPSVTIGSSSSLSAPNEHPHQHGLWRQLKRMQLQGSWRRLTLRTGGTDRTTPNPPKQQSTEASPASNTRSATVTALEGLGRRFDSHRRSIKKRIKNLCERIDPVTTAATSSAQQSPNVAPEPASGAGPEPASHGPPSRKSVSLDSFLLAKGQGRPQDTVTLGVTTW